MRPPPNTEVFETELATIWFDENGILCSISKKTNRTLDKQKKTLELIKRISGNKKVCVLSEITNIPPQDHETRNYVASESPTMFKAMAFVSNSFLSRTIIKIFLALKGQPIPIKMFGDENEAKEWLKQYL